ncbi:SGNH/GDSL hydrolase family protein [Tenacibaculum ovolyticum]|uniref:SGNH/GDSL hydrolase family protein n=1 Tax=Tenacibaculum ovolyticum TaxID=104270 RepID=UPI00041BAADD|nr:SGNH/GDSL hydrolase family protein [Tenacibaculum ovolyticum]
MKKVERIVIFGDSLSDIGVKANTATGILGRLIGEVRVNKIKRFSDNKNWTDFIWEWSGGNSLVDGLSPEQTNELTSNHLSLKNSRTGSKNNSLSYCNYATGGAVADTPKGLVHKFALTTFEEQVNDYKKDLEKTENDKPNNNLFVVWFGLNDIVTNKKGIELMQETVQRLTALCHEVDEITKAHNSASENSFIIVNNPDPSGAVRYIENPKSEEVVSLRNATIEFNSLLKDAFQTKNDSRFTVLDAFTFLKQNLYSLDVIKIDQAAGVPVQYYSDSHEPVSLSKALRDFLNSIDLSKEKEATLLKEFIDAINNQIKSALKTDNEIVLHKDVSKMLLDLLPKIKKTNKKFTKALKLILLTSGLFINRVEFAIKYYSTQKNKHADDIHKIQTVIDQISSKNLLTSLTSDLYNRDVALYNTLSDVLTRVNKNSSFKELLTLVIAQKFGFFATSDKAHPTEAAYKLLATLIAVEFAKKFPNLSLGESFISNAFEHGVAETSFTEESILSV